MAKQEAARDRYDVAVVGGGVAGLVTGALLAKAGRSVVVLEAEDRPGGYARSFESGRSSFDLADHAIMSCGADGPFGEGLLHQVLASIGVADQLSFTRLDPFYAIHHGGDRFVIPGGREAHVAALAAYFPPEEAGIRTLFATYDRIYEELIAAPVESRIRDLLAMPRRLPLTFRDRHLPLARLLDRHISDPVLRLVHTALWLYFGLPLSRASALGWGGMMASYAGEGAFYVEGGYQRLADALADGLRQQGGELVCGEPVGTIDVRGGAAAGVTTASGNGIAADTVVACMDPRAALGSMLSGATVPWRYRRRLERGEPAMSVYALYLSADMDLFADRLAHETVVSSTDAEQAYWRSRTGAVDTVLVTTPTLTDPGRSPVGQHTIVVKAACPDDEHGHDPAAIAAAMLELAERAIPGLRDRVAHVHGRSDEEPWPLHRLGPMYGWAMTPEQMGPYRLGHHTPIGGLYLAGHWSQPAAGIWGATASGVQLARVLLTRDPHGPLAPIQV